MPRCRHAHDERQDHTCTDECTCEHHTASTLVAVHDDAPALAPRTPEPPTRAA